MLLLFVAGAVASCVAEVVSPEDLAIVMHSGHPERRSYVDNAKRTWLSKVPHYVIVDGMRTSSRRLMHVFYDDNPGCSQAPCRDQEPPKYLKIGKYFGAHRTLAGLLVANDTWPGARWVLVVDDDNAVQVDVVRKYLEDLDSSVPLLLAGRIGPGHDVIPCKFDETNRSAWSCCTDASRPCYSHLYGPQAVWEYDASVQSFVPKVVCPENEVSNYCCRTSPWSEGIGLGFPYKTDPQGSYRPHFSLLWPYGGAGYILSRGMLDAIRRDHWEKCMYAFQCANADHRVMACVLNAGFSLTRHLKGIPGIRHHVRPPGGVQSSSGSQTAAANGGRSQRARRGPHVVARENSNRPARA